MRVRPLHSGAGQRKKRYTEILGDGKLGGGAGTPGRPARSVPWRKRNRKGPSVSSESYHEPVGELSKEVRDMHRAILSLMEELEAVDWYNQRAHTASDPELKKVLEHNRDEEKEHAAMTLEWIRRKDPVFDRYLREFLFTDASIVEAEEEGKGG